MEDCIELTLEREMLTTADDIAFVSIHRHRSALACFRIDLPTTNQLGDAQLLLATLQQARRCADRLIVGPSEPQTRPCRCDTRTWSAQESQW